MPRAQSQFPGCTTAPPASDWSTAPGSDKHCRSPRRSPSAEPRSDGKMFFGPELLVASKVGMRRIEKN